MAVQVASHRFTVADYHKMAEAHILDEDDRVELIEGEIVDTTPIGRRHAACVARLTDLFVRGLSRNVIVWTQNPIHLDEHSEPQPDLALLRWRPDFYATADPGPANVLLVVEVADASLPYDRDVKLPLFARAGIPEAWLVDLNGADVTVCRDPRSEGYGIVLAVRGDDRLRPEAFPGFALTADQILGA